MRGGNETEGQEAEVVYWKRARSNAGVPQVRGLPNGLPQGVVQSPQLTPRFIAPHPVTPQPLIRMVPVRPTPHPFWCEFAEGVRAIQEATASIQAVSRDLAFRLALARQCQFMRTTDQPQHLAGLGRHACEEEGRKD